MKHIGLLVGFILLNSVLNCLGTRCKIPRRLKHGSISGAHRRNLVKPGNTIVYRCDKGYHINLSNSDDYSYYDYIDDLTVNTYERTCQSDGSWTGYDIQRCEQPSCSQLGRPEHLILSPDKDVYYSGDTVEFTCAHGYALIGPSVKICMATGWNTYTTTKCERIYCPPPHLDFGMLQPEKYTYWLGDTVSMHCFDGYQLYGPESLQCTEHYGWNTTAFPLCRPKFIDENVAECLDPGIPPGAVVRQRGEWHITYDCESKSLIMDGDSTIYCDPKTYEWSSDPPICKTIHCFDSIPVLADKLSFTMEALQMPTEHLRRRKKRHFTDAFKADTSLTLYFVIDQSGSISEEDFNKIRLSVNALIDKLHVKPLSDDGPKTRVGIIGFADKANTVLLPYLGESDDKESIKRIVNSLHRMENATDIRAGLTQLMHVIDNTINVSGWVNHVRISNKAVIMITDGKYNIGGEPYDLADNIRLKGYQTFAVGVTQTTNDPDLTRLVHKDKVKEDVYTLLNKTSYLHLAKEMTQRNATLEYFECGLGRASDCNTPTSQIRNGRGATHLEFPWTVRIIKSQTLGPTSSTATKETDGVGSLISDTWVLTAAHVLNDTNLNGFLLAFGKEDKIKMRAKAKFVHPEYTKTDNKSMNDLVLLKLENQIPLDKEISPVCLPKPIAILNKSQNFDAVMTQAYTPGKQGSVAAWGGSAVNFEQACFPIIRCPKIYESVFCAGQESADELKVTDTEKGDSGSALVRKLSSLSNQRLKRFVQIGLTSHNANEEDNDVIGVGGYTKILDYMEWITQIISDYEKTK